MNDNLTQYQDFIKESDKKLSVFYLTLLLNAAIKKDEARKRYRSNEEDIDQTMKTIRKYDRMMDYLIERWKRELKRREFGNA